MKRAILIACVLLAAVGCGRVAANRAWEALPLGTKADFDDVWFADALHGWIAGGSYEITGGLIGRTSDGGRTWRFVSNLTKREGMSVQAIHFFDTDRGIAVTGSGTILETMDGGASWTPAARQGRVAGLSSLFFLDERRGWAAGTGHVIRTEDAGDNWIATLLVRRGTANKGSVQVDLARRGRDLKIGPVSGYFYMQYFNGYGESLRGYDVRFPWQLRVGLAIIP